MRDAKNWCRVFCIGLLALSLGSCQLLSSPRAMKIKCLQSSYGQWYDYYWSGLACMDENRLDDAVSELSQAIKMRGTDKRRVYIGGMHWITDYFPNRELGITYYLKKQPVAAIERLKRSLDQFPSAKAEQYLNDSRQLLPANIGKDLRPPVIEHFVNVQSQLVLTIKDETFVEKVQLNNKPLVWLEAEQRGDALITYQPAKAEVVLTVPLAKVGEQILIVAEDIFGRKRSLNLSFYLDKTAPMLSKFKVRPTRKGRWRVSGVITDEKSAPKHLTIGSRFKSDGKILNGKPVSQLSFETVVINNPMTLTATDLNGNQLIQRIDLTTKQSLELKNISVPTVLQTERLSINGIAISHAQSPVLSLKINGEPITIKNGVFECKTKVPMGRSHFNIVLSSPTETIEQSFSVNRVAPDPSVAGEELRVALFPFTCERKKGGWCDKQHYQQLQQQMENLKRFDMVEQTYLESHLVELVLCDAGMADGCIRKKLRIGSPDVAMVGDIVKRKGVETTGNEAYSQIIDAASGKVLVTFDAYAAGKAGDTGPELVAKVYEKFPVLASTHVQVDETHLEATFKYPKLLWKNMPVKLFYGKEVCEKGMVIESTDTSVLAALRKKCALKSNEKPLLITM